jgi:outer membrane protein assembly factor BamD (BamD/ComL family)
MKIKYFTLSVILAIVLFSCGDSDVDQNQSAAENQLTAEQLKVSIQEIDDSLFVLTKKKMKNPDFKIDRLVYHEGINRSKNFFESYPEDDYAKTALEKIASLYFQLQIEGEAAKWRDSILLHYPKTESRPELLIMQMSYYDFDNHNKEKLTYYLNELLSLKSLSKEQRSDYQFRLKHIDKSHSELMELHNNDSVPIEVIQ